MNVRKNLIKMPMDWMLKEDPQEIGKEDKSMEFEDQDELAISNIQKNPKPDIPCQKYEN